MSKEWCKHLIWRDGYFDFYPNSENPIRMIEGGFWKFCPICGKPELPKQMRLEQKLKDVLAKRCAQYTEFGSLSDFSVVDELASVAKSHFLQDREDELENNLSSIDRDIIAFLKERA